MSDYKLEELILIVTNVELLKALIDQTDIRNDDVEALGTLMISCNKLQSHLTNEHIKLYLLHSTILQGENELIRSFEN